MRRLRRNHVRTPQRRRLIGACTEEALGRPWAARRALSASGTRDCFHLDSAESAEKTAGRVHPKSAAGAENVCCDASALSRESGNEGRQLRPDAHAGPRELPVGERSPPVRARLPTRPAGGPTGRPVTQEFGLRSGGDTLGRCVWDEGERRTHTAGRPLPCASDAAPETCCLVLSLLVLQEESLVAHGEAQHCSW